MLLTNESISYDFNPRTHVECDRDRHYEIIRKVDFNPRTHVECDLMETIRPKGSKYFNPRTHTFSFDELNRVSM